MQLKLILMSSLLIHGCAALDTAPKIHASAYERRPENILNIDKTIETDIGSELNANKKLLRGSHLSIDAYNRAVLLTGEVPSLSIKQKITSLVRVIKPIKQVYDYLTIEQATDLNSRAVDIKITQDVQNAFKQIHGSKTFHADAVKVITTHQVVYLMGLVHYDEGEIVIKLARLQANVQGVVTLFEYLD